MTVNATLSLGLMTIPVALKTIGEKKDVTTDRASKNGNPIGRMEVDKVTGEVVTSADIQRGVFREDGTFAAIDAETLAAIEESTKLEAFEITEFIPLASVPWERAQSSYYLAPQRSAKGPTAGKAMAILHRAMLGEKKSDPTMAGVMKLTLKTRQYLAVVYPKGSGLYVTLLAWSEDWAQADEANVLDAIAVEKAHAAAARSLVMTLATDDVAAALDSKSDDVRPLRLALIEEAQTSGKITKRAKKSAPVVPETDSLMSALEASLAAAR